MSEVLIVTFFAYFFEGGHLILCVIAQKLFLSLKKIIFLEERNEKSFFSVHNFGSFSKLFIKKWSDVLMYSLDILPPMYSSQVLVWPLNFIFIAFIQVILD